MAFTKFTGDTAVHQALADRPTQTASQLKVLFDKSATELKTYLNDTLTEEIEATTGAASIGIATPSGMSASNVQTAIAELHSDHDTFVASGNFLGTWQGYSPVQSDPGIQAIVNTHTDRLKLVSTVFNVVDGYSADNTGVSDSTAAIQSAATAATGGVLFFPEGSYKITAKITIGAGTTVIGYGASIFSSTDVSLLAISSGVTVIGLTLYGPGHATANSTYIGIELIGTVSSYVDKVSIIGCNIHDIKGYGICGSFAKNVVIRDCNVHDIGYAAIAMLSCEYVVVDSCVIKDISPGITSRVYGVFFSRTENDSLVDYPRCKFCKVSNSYIENASIWEALDTHGGEDISFDGNTITGCSIGISIAGSDNTAGDTIFPPIRCSATNNTIYGDGTGIGIVCSGSSVSGTDYFADSCCVVGNKMVECGENANSISGAIKAAFTMGACISANSLKDCYANGIVATSKNVGISITGNSVVDVQDSTYATPSGIAIRNNDNTGVISGNTVLLLNPALNTYVSVRGIHFTSATTGNMFTIGNNYGTFTNEFAGITANNARFAEAPSAGVRLYSGSGIPEGAVAAGVASLYLRTNGGAGTTFYVKETGTGNTGWVAK